MGRKWIIAAVLLLSTAATGVISQEPKSDVRVVGVATAVADYTFAIKDGKYYLLNWSTMTFTEARLNFIVPPGPTPPEPPVPPQPPVPPAPDLSARAKAIKQVVDQVIDSKKAENKVALANVYAAVAAKIRANQLTDAVSVAAAIKTATDSALTQAGSLAAWQSVRDSITTYWALLAQEGAAVAKYAELLDDVVAALNAS